MGGRNWRGWVLFGILMAVHLLKDVIILFIADIDEMLHSLVVTFHRRVVNKEKVDAQVKEEMKTLVEEENNKLKVEMKTELKENMKTQLEEKMTEWDEKIEAEVSKRVQVEVAKLSTGLVRQFDEQLKSIKTLAGGNRGQG